MLSRQRVSLILAATLVASLLVLLGATYNNGEVSASAKSKGKVLRRYDKLHLKPTKQELDSLHGQVPANEERLFENMIPMHVPLGVRIRKEKEKEFKDLKNDKWARDFALEITNTGQKPIYHFYLLLVTDVKASAGFRIVAPLYYGRRELGTISTLATTDDVALKPGESVILTIHSGQLDAWDHVRKTENRPHPKKIQIKLEGLSFGDGTGFGGEDGVALPRTPEQVNIDRCIPQKNKSAPQILARLEATRQSKTIRASGLPATFLPVNFLSAVALAPNLLKPEPTDCCPVANCTSLINHVEHPCVNCPDQNRPTITYCSDPAGSCFDPEYDSIECYTGNGHLYLCQTIAMPGCGTPPPPTPTPTPTPTSTSTPTPTPEPCIPGVCLDDNPTTVQADNCNQDYSGGCPNGYTRSGNCCLPPCPLPTPTPLSCPGGILIRPSRLTFCNWVCIKPLLVPGSGGGDGQEPGDVIENCNNYYWVWYSSSDGGETWTPTGEIDNAGCW